MEQISKTRLERLYWLLSDMAVELRQPRERANYRENLERRACMECAYLRRHYKHLLIGTGSKRQVRGRCQSNRSRPSRTSK